MNRRPATDPSIPGCAFGFGMAGCGIGSLVGMGIGARIKPPLREEQRGTRADFHNFYYGLFEGIALGFILGALAGVAYAVIVRRRRRRN